MRPGKKYGPIFILAVFIVYSFVYCSRGVKSPGDEPRLFQKEIAIIDTLLRDSLFAEFMARSLDSAYYASAGKVQPAFLADTESSATQSLRLRDEKVATSLAPFYALECGIELLSNNSGETFVTWMQKIGKGEAGSEAMLLLNRFANATWKAGQPFRHMERLTRYNFRVAGLLSTEETAKDSVQIVNAAKKLSVLMNPVSKSSQEEQLKFLGRILHDTVIAVDLAFYADWAFAVSQHQTLPARYNFMSDTATVKKTVKQLKIATSVAGFYALECGLNYLVATKQMLPSKTLRLLVSGSLNKEDKMLFARFANATWKACQPFRGLDRIRCEIFTPFYFLPEAEIDKDIIQVKAAGKILLSYLENNTFKVLSN